MKDSDKNVNNALSDIFGDDTIDIDVNNESNTNDETPPFQEELYPPENTMFIDKDLALFSGEFYEPEEDVTNEFFNQAPVNPVTPLNNPEMVNLAGKEDAASEAKEGAGDQVKKPRKKRRVVKKKDGHPKMLPVNLTRFLPNKNNAMYFGIGIVLIISTLVILFKFVFVGDKVMTCSFTANDIGYELLDEYKITYRKNTIKYVDGTYKYTVKLDEYKSQLSILKEEKLPVILNSNGMPGFTYLYEIGEDYFLVSSYLDFTLFDFKSLDKNSNEVNPISYFPISSKTSSSSLKKHFEKSGYKCSVGK